MKTSFAVAVILAASGSMASPHGPVTVGGHATGGCQLDEGYWSAQTALDAEKNELTHKPILVKLPKVTKAQAIQSANNSLETVGQFQAIVDALADMVNKGPSVAVSDRDAINANRCVNVLPAIEAYLEAAGTPFRAARPTVCDVTGVKRGQPGSGSAPASGQGSTATTTSSRTRADF